MKQGDKRLNRKLESSKLLPLVCVLSFFSGVRPGLLAQKMNESALILRIPRVEEVSARILTKTRPIAITVEGPADLKITTYLLFADTGKKVEKYSLVLESEEGEKFYNFETRLSRIRDTKGRRFGRARSIRTDVPPGTHHFRLHLFSAQKETVGVRFSVEKARWSEVIPTLCQGEVFILKRGERIRYFMTPAIVKVKGGSYKVSVRSLYEGEEGKESLWVVIDGLEKGFLVEESPGVKTDLGKKVSIVKAFYLDLPAGERKIEVKGKRKGLIKVYEKVK